MQAPTAQEVLVVAAILYAQKKLLIFRRGPSQSGAGFWEFPGGKVDVGEDPVQALSRELEEELSLQAPIEECLGETVYQYPSKKIRLRFYWVPITPQISFHMHEHDAFQWVDAQTLDVQILSPADREIVGSLRQDPRLKV